MYIKLKRGISILIVIIMLLSVLPIYAVAEESFELQSVSTSSYSPYAKIEYNYSAGVTCGTIRYICQTRSGTYFSWNYWPTSSFGSYTGGPENECSTACISMALSYIGINETPKVHLEKYDGKTTFAGAGGASYSSLGGSGTATAVDRYINGNGKYSPPVIHIPKYSAAGHYVVVMGKISSNQYQILDPWDLKVTTMTINGSSATYSKYGTTIYDTIDEVHQWYNPNGQIVDNTTPGKPAIKGTKMLYASGSAVSFSWDATKNTTHYNLYIEKKADSGEYKYFNNVFYAESGYSYAFPDGEYKVTLQSTNSNAWTEDGSTWKYTNGDPVYFSVGNATATLKGTSVPSEIVCGTNTYITGVINTNSPMNWVWIGVCDREGTTNILECVAYPGSTSFDITPHANSLDFASLPVGDYYFAVHCIANGEYLVPGKFDFSIVSTPDSTAAPVAKTLYNNHKYELFDYHMGWWEAEDYCKKRGGTLVSITSQEENNEVLKLINQGASSIYYIGCTDELRDGSWTWTTLEPFGYSNWDSHSPEPTNGVDEDYGAIMSKAYAPNKHPGEWIDTTEKEKNGFYAYTNCGFVCEVPLEYSNTWTFDDNTHWHACTDADYPELKQDEAPHSWDAGTVTISPTCIRQGVRTYSCICGASYTEPIAAKGHKSETIPAKAATCTETGLTEGSKCSVCGEILVAQKTIPALVHSFTHYVYNNDAQVGVDGTETAVCDRDGCHETDTRTAEGTALPSPDPEPDPDPAPDPDPDPDPTPQPSENPFVDVKSGDYYYDAVMWAVANNITNGTSPTTFSPDQGCTRGQVVTFLWRKAGSPEPASTRNPFKDVNSNSIYYKAILWAVEKGITQGFEDGTFRPNAICTRGQVATFLWRAVGKPTPTSTKNPFTDVKTSSPYYEGILWASGQGITLGYNDGTFRPNATCTRAHVVTFLYRTYA